jgi:hypothetical protein
MRTALFLLATLTLPALAQQKMQAPDLIALAQSGKPGLHEAITSSFDAKALQDPSSSSPSRPMPRRRWSSTTAHPLP